jgi:hypothetical protein
MLLVDETVASGVDCDAWCSGVAHDFLPLHFDRRGDGRCLQATLIRARLNGHQEATFRPVKLELVRAYALSLYTVSA